MSNQGIPHVISQPRNGFSWKPSVGGRCDNALQCFASGRCSFAGTIATLYGANQEPGGLAALFASLQRAIDARLLPSMIAQALRRVQQAPWPTQVTLAGAAPYGLAGRGATAHDGEEVGARMGRELCGRFVLDAQIGRGGMGVVYRAIDRRRRASGDGPPYVAIKLLSAALEREPFAIEALEAEALLTRKLNHSNIVTVHDFGREHGDVFMVMELLVGSSCSVLLRRHGDFPGSARARLALQGLLDGLASAHRKGVVHGDLKPANLFICSDGRLKIIDFGLAAVLSGGPEAEAAGGALTLAYASPERLSGHMRSPRDDVYATGCLVHDLLAGRHPFGRLNAHDAMMQGLQPPLVPGLSEKDNAVVAASLAFDKARRPADASALRTLISFA